MGRAFRRRPSSPRPCTPCSRVSMPPGHLGMHCSGRAGSGSFRGRGQRPRMALAMWCWEALATPRPPPAPHLGLVRGAGRPRMAPACSRQICAIAVQAAQGLYAPDRPTDGDGNITEEQRSGREGAPGPRPVLGGHTAAAPYRLGAPRCTLLLPPACQDACPDPSLHLPGAAGKAAQPVSSAAAATAPAPTPAAAAAAKRQITARPKDKPRCGAT